jgi:GTP-binding protein EngB required for normal cell division
MDWSSFTKGYFLNRDTLVGVLLLVDASVPPQKIDLDCANWLGRNNVRQLALHLIMSLNAGWLLKYQLTYLHN